MAERPVTLITGTRKGIGRFLAERYATRGHCVIGCSRKAPDWSLEGYEHFEADVGDEAAVKRLVGETRKRHGRIDHLINNAGIASMNHSLLTPLDTARRVMETNFLGTFLLCREVAKVMQRSRTGRIVNLSSVAVRHRLEGEAVYAASKAAVETLTQVLARELASFEITVNCVTPTPIETDLIRGVPRDKIDALVGRQAIPRLGTPEDVANAIDFFLSPASHYVTGQNLVLGGA